MIEAACSVTGSHPGEDGPSDISLRILADHGRAISALIADGIFPSNEGRGYVLRRLIRRAVRHGQRLQRQPGESLILPVLCRAAIGTLGQEYQDMERSAGLIESVVGKEEERFLETLRSGMVILDDALARSPKEIPGELVFRLHDTFGFPVELTAEVAAERGVVLDRAGFEAAMAEQKKRARKAGAASRAVSEVNDAYLAVLDATGPTEFVGYDTERAEASLVAAVPVEGGKANQVEYDLFLDRTPFYSEAGGQVGDRGVVTVGDARYRVIDTQAVLPGLVAHRARLVHGPVTVSGDAQAEVDHEFRQRTSRHHTATHLLHAALRQVLGDHVRQQGSLVTEDRLRFDFSHFQGATRDELEEVENRVNEQVLTNALVETRIMAKSDAEALGAIAFFGDKYGASVRVVTAGPSSIELCGGTHVGALGSVGLVRIVSEASIGSNTRRLEALAGSAALAHMAAERHHLLAAADLLGAPPDQLSSALGRLLERRRELENEVKEARRVALAAEAADLAGRTAGSVVVARRDGLSGDRLRELAVAVRERPGVSSVALAGSPDGRSVALAAAVTPGRSLATAGSAVAKAARLVGGGGGQGTEVAVAGGRDVSKIDDALEVMRAELAG
jgi:alanyl-tRNA synthetase